jgi:hemoglobin/transferrin/lactoferrin receptor protein
MFLLSLLIMTAYGQVKQEMFMLDGDDIAKEGDAGRTEIISASRSAQYLDELPITIYVISREEILKNGYTTLVDVLKDIPGMKVSQPGSGVEGETFLMNGLFGNYYCKILVDNIPIQPSVVSGMPIGEQLPIRQAERIEVIYGPSSAIYGADAIAGVINIITKTSDRPTWAQADITLGNHGYYNTDVTIGGKTGKNKNVIDYTFFGSNSYQKDMNVKYDIENLYNPSKYGDSSAFLQAPYYKGDSSIPQMNNLSASSRLMGFGLKFRGLNFNYTHMFRKSHSSIGQIPSTYAYYDQESFWAEKIDRYSLSYSNQWGKLTSTTNLSYLHYRMDNNSSFRLIYEVGDEGRVYKYAASDDIQLDEVLSFNISPNLELTGGFSMQVSGNLPVTNDLNAPFDESKYKPFFESVNVSDSILGSFGYNPTNFYNTAGFAQLFYKLGQFSFIAGGRYDYNSIFGGSFNPRLGLLYKISDNLSVRSSYGQGFRAPSLYYAYNSVAYVIGDIVRYQSVPNTDLKPERFSSLDFGIRHNPFEKLFIEMVFTYHNLKDNITNSIVVLDPILYPNSDLPYSLSVVNDENSRAELFSTQVIIKTKDIIPIIPINADLYITYSKGKEILPNQLGTLSEYRNMPNWITQFNLEIQPIESITLILQNYYCSSSKKRFFPLEPMEMESLGIPTDVEGYYTLDMISRFMINRNFQAFFKLNNIFNAEYGGIDAYGSINDMFYNPQYKRYFQIGLSFRME